MPVPPLINIPTPVQNLLEEPEARHPAHEDTWIGYYTGDADKTNYRYLFQIYINAVKVSTLAVRPSVTNLVDNQYGVGYANIRPILSSYAPTNYFNPPAAGSRTAITPYVEYYFKVADTWEDASGNVCGATRYDSSTFGNNRAYNASRKYTSQVGIYYTGINQGQFNKFQTARVSREIRLSGQENFFMTAFYLNFVGYRLKQYQGETLVSTNDVTFSGDCIINFKNLAPGIGAGTTRYTVQLMTNFGTNTSNDVEYTFILDCGNPKTTTRVVHFMNNLGGFDTAYFRGSTRKRLAATRQRVTLDGSILNTSTYAMDKVGANNVFYGGARDYSAQYQEPVLLTTEFLSDQDYEFYAQLVTSPAVYLEETINGSTYFVPCVVSQDNYVFRNRRQDGLTSLEMELIPAFTNYSPGR